MTVHLELSPDKDSDWLARVAAGDSEDIWAELDEDDRKRRADSAQVDALVRELTGRDLFSQEAAASLGRVFFESLSDEEFREIRKQALQSESDADYVDKIATILADLIEERISIESNDHSVPVLTSSAVSEQLVSYSSSTAPQLPTALFTGEQQGFLPFISLEFPVVEFSEDAEQLITDYSIGSENTPSQTTDSR